MDALAHALFSTPGTIVLVILGLGLTGAGVFMLPGLVMSFYDTGDRAALALFGGLVVSGPALLLGLWFGHRVVDSSPATGLALLLGLPLCLPLLGALGLGVQTIARKMRRRGTGDR